MDTSHDNEISVCSTDEESEESSDSDFEMDRPKRALPGSERLAVLVRYLTRGAVISCHCSDGPVPMGLFRWACSDGPVPMGLFRWAGGDGPVAMGRWRLVGVDWSVSIARSRLLGRDCSVAIARSRLAVIQMVTRSCLTPIVYITGCRESGGGHI